MNTVPRIFIAALALSIAAASARAAERQQQWAGAGVTVTEVVPHTAAASAGIRPGDVVVSINGNAVYSYADIDHRWRLAAVVR